MESKVDRAWVLVELGRLDAGREMFAEVLAADPEDWSALTGMAEVALRLGEYARALEYSELALRVVPEHSLVWRIRALAKAQEAADTLEPVWRRELREQAVQSALRATEIDPEDVDNLRVLAVTRRETDPGAALENLDEALEIDPGNVDVHVLRGSILHHHVRGPNSLELAEAAFRTALELAPENTEALLELALIELAHGRLDVAREELLRAAVLEPARGGQVRALLETIDRERDRRALALRAALGPGPDDDPPVPVDYAAIVAAPPAPDPAPNMWVAVSGYGGEDGADRPVAGEPPAPGSGPSSPEPPYDPVPPPVVHRSPRPRRAPRPAPPPPRPSGGIGGRLIGFGLAALALVAFHGIANSGDDDAGDRPGFTPPATIWRTQYRLPPTLYPDPFEHFPSRVVLPSGLGQLPTRAPTAPRVTLPPNVNPHQ